MPAVFEQQPVSNTPEINSAIFIPEQRIGYAKDTPIAAVHYNDFFKLQSEQGLCPQIDAETFYPEKGQATAAAKRICKLCAIAPQCLEYALAMDERHGIWGGASERERRMIKRDRAVTNSVVA